MSTKFSRGGRAGDQVTNQTLGLFCIIGLDAEREYQSMNELQTIKAEKMGRVDSMTKVPPPDNNDAGCQCLHLCPRPPSGGRGRIMCVAHPSAQNHLSTCHFPFAFKGPFHADARPDTQTATEENGHLAKGLEFSLSPSVIHCSN